MHGDELNTLAQREAIRFKEEQDRQDEERRKQAKAGDAIDFQKIIQESDVIKPVPMVWSWMCVDTANVFNVLLLLLKVQLLLACGNEIA